MNQNNNNPNRKSPNASSSNPSQGSLPQQQFNQYPTMPPQFNPAPFGSQMVDQLLQHMMLNAQTAFQSGNGFPQQNNMWSGSFVVPPVPVFPPTDFSSDPISTNPPTSTQQKEKFNENAYIRAEQDLQYEESLRKDEERELQKKMEQDKKKEDELFLKLQEALEETIKEEKRKHDSNKF